MEINIKDAAQNGTATAALMVATSLFMQVISNRFVATFSRYRSLAEEYRAGKASEERRASLRDQIELYRKRCGALRRAGQCLPSRRSALCTFDHGRHLGLCVREA